ncbi:hypothetical protein OO013_17445 [Mangrovivirga sp. M17]|uniref:Uncharacterized protein n=1 Tax=Mangrovivirga halotolerans TaxID=2993936 RepID=A0ABT3RVW6_9BACT|nr:hypothetical protein [Mangrovivirga halotolerans]MCX2745671.1 hypothetical protein [Mangrovivirga halotolerans]
MKILTKEELEIKLNEVFSEIKSKNITTKNLLSITSEIIESCVEIKLDEGSIYFIYHQKQKAHPVGGISINQHTSVLIPNPYNIKFIYDENSKLIEIKSDNINLTKKLIEKINLIPSYPIHFKKGKELNAIFKLYFENLLLIKQDSFITSNEIINKVIYFYAYLLEIFNEFEES